MIIKNNKNLNFLQHNLIIGKFSKPHGIQGWITVYSFTDVAECILQYQPWFINKLDLVQFIKLNNWKINNKKIIVKIDGINDRNNAQFFKNYKIFIKSDILPKLSDGNYYWRDIINCTVFNENRYILGKVKEIVETKSNDILVVQATLNDCFKIKKRFIPFIERQFIKSINIDKKIIKVIWNPKYF